MSIVNIQIWRRVFLQSFFMHWLMPVLLLCVIVSSSQSQQVADIEMCWERVIDSCEDSRIKSVDTKDGLIYVLISCGGDKKISSWKLICLDSTGQIQWRFFQRMAADELYSRVEAISNGACRVYWVDGVGDSLILYCSSIDNVGNEISTIKVLDEFLSVIHVETAKGDIAFLLVNRRISNGEKFLSGVCIVKWNFHTGVEWVVDLKSYSIVVGIGVKFFHNNGCIVSGRSTISDDGMLVLLRVLSNGEVRWVRNLSFNASYMGEEMAIVGNVDLIVFGGALSSNHGYRGGFVLFSLEIPTGYLNWVNTYTDYQMFPFAGTGSLSDTSMILISTRVIIHKIDKYGTTTLLYHTMSDTNRTCEKISILDKSCVVLAGRVDDEFYSNNLFVRRYRIK